MGRYRISTGQKSHDGRRQNKVKAQPVPVVKKQYKN